MNMVTPIPGRVLTPQIEKSFKQWSQYADMFRVLHVILGTIGIVGSILIASKIFDSKSIWMIILPIVVVFAVGLFGSFQIEHKANGYRACWRELSSAIIRFKYESAFDADLLNLAYQDAINKLPKSSSQTVSAKGNFKSIQKSGKLVPGRTDPPNEIMGYLSTWESKSFWLTVFLWFFGILACLLAALLEVPNLEAYKSILGTTMAISTGLVSGLNAQTKLNNYDLAIAKLYVSVSNWQLDPNFTLGDLNQAYAKGEELIGNVEIILPTKPSTSKPIPMPPVVPPAIPPAPIVPP